MLLHVVRTLSEKSAIVAFLGGRHCVSAECYISPRPLFYIGDDFINQQEGVPVSQRCAPGVQICQTLKRVQGSPKLFSLAPQPECFRPS